MLLGAVALATVSFGAPCAPALSLATRTGGIVEIGSIIYIIAESWPSMAPVVQWIERLTPNELIEVRFLSRAQRQHLTQFQKNSAALRGAKRKV